MLAGGGIYLQHLVNQESLAAELRKGRSAASRSLFQVCGAVGVIQRCNQSLTKNIGLAKKMWASEPQAGVAR